MERGATVDGLGRRRTGLLDADRVVLEPRPNGGELVGALARARAGRRCVSCIPHEPSVREPQEAPVAVSKHEQVGAEQPRVGSQPGEGLGDRAEALAS